MSANPLVLDSVSSFGAATVSTSSLARNSRECRSHSHLMAMILTLVFGVSMACTASAQTAINLSAAQFNNSGVSGNAFPLGMTGGTNGAGFSTIYTAAQLNNTAGQIIEFGWQYHESGGPRTWPAMKYWMGYSTTVSPVPTPTSNYMSYFTSPPTLVYDGSYTWSVPAAGDYVRVALQVPFQYDGTSTLMIHVEIPAGTSPVGSTPQTRVYTSGGTTVPNFRLYNSTSLSTAPSVGNNYAMGASFLIQQGTTNEVLSGTPEVAGPGGTAGQGYPFNRYYHDQQYQAIYLASELQAAGLTGGARVITSVSIKPSQVSALEGVQNMRVRMKNFTPSVIPQLEQTGFTDVFGPVTLAAAALTVNSYYKMNLTTPFLWDGTSNLLIEFTQDGSNYDDIGPQGGVVLRTVTGQRAIKMNADDSAGPFPFTLPYPSAGSVIIGSLTNGVPSLELSHFQPAAPAITTISLANALEGVPYSATVVASGGGGGPYNWSITAGALPNGLTIHPTTGVISGTPGPGTSQAAAYDFTVTATDASGSGSKPFSITIPPISITTPAGNLPTVQIGAAYNTTIAATGGGVTKTFAISAGTLPAGLSLNPATGAITGTPTAVVTSTFSVSVTDGTALVSAQYTIQVTPVLLTLEYGTGVSTATSSTPLYRSSSSSSFNYSLQQTIYRPSDLAGLSSGSQIFRVYFNKTNNGATTAGRQNVLRVYLKNTTDNEYLTTSTYANAKVGATLVVDRTDFVMPDTIGWIEFGPMLPSANFVYTGGNLEVTVESDVNQGTSPWTTNSYSWRHNTYSGNSLGRGYSSSSAYTESTSLSTTTNGGNTRHPHLKLDFIPPPFNATIAGVTFNGGDLPQPGNNVVAVTIRNDGSSTLNGVSLPISMAIDANAPIVETFMGGAGLSSGQTQSFTFVAPLFVTPGVSQVAKFNFSPQITGDPNTLAEDERSYLLTNDIDLVTVETNPALPIIGNNSVRVTLRNSGGLSVTGVTIPLEYSVNNGVTWVTQNFVPSGTQLNSNNSTHLFTFTTPWALLAPGSYNLMVRIGTQVPGDPDASDELSEVYPAAGFDTFSTVGAGGSGSSGQQPLYRSAASSTINRSRYQMLYTPTELAGLPNNTKIGGVQFQKVLAGSFVSNNVTLRVWLRNSSTLSFTGTATWDTEIAGATLIYDSNTFNMPEAAGWMMMGGYNQPGDFFYGGQSLEVFVEYDGSAIPEPSTTAAIFWQYGARTGTSTNSQIRGTNSTVAFTPTTTITQSSSIQYSRIMNMRILHKAPAAFDADLETVNTSDGMVGIGNNTVVAMVKNAGSNSLNGPIAIEYSDNGTTWTSQTFTATTLGTLGSTETFTFTAPWVISTVGQKNLTVRFVTQVTGDPDPVAADVATLSFVPDLDVVSESQFPAGVPRLGSNTVRVTVANNGKFRLNGASIPLSYVIGAAAPVNQTFTASTLNELNSTEVFQFTTPWSLASVQNLVGVYSISPQIAGDPDATDALTVPYTDAGLLLSQIGPAFAPEVASNAVGSLGNSYYHDQRMQSLITVAEMTAAGFRLNTPLTKVHVKFSGLPGFDSVSQAFRNLDNVRIRMQHTLEVDASGPLLDAGWTDCFGPTTINRSQITVGDWMPLTFATPFVWDGSSNVFIELSSDSTFYSDNASDGGIFVRSTAPEIRTRRMYVDASGFPWIGVPGSQNTAADMPVMRFEFGLPPDVDLDIMSLVVNNGTGAIQGNNQVKVSVRNGGLLTRTGVPFQLQYSIDGINWVTEGFTPTALTDGSIEDFTFVAPLVRTDLTGFTLQARIVPVAGDPDTVDAASVSFSNDLDLLSVQAGNPSADIGNNPITFVIQNTGSFNLTNTTATMMYRVDIGTTVGTPVTQSFPLATLGSPGQQDTFTFTAPWVITQNRAYKLTVAISPQLSGDPDTSDEIVQSIAVNVPVAEFNLGSTLSSTSGFPIARSSATITSDISIGKYIYTPDMLNMPAGSEIFSIAFFKTDAFGTTADEARLKVFLRNVDNAYYASNESYPFGTLFDGMTKVFDTDTFGIPAAAGWLNLGPFNGPSFIYTGGNLEVGVEWDCSFINGGAGNPSTGGFSFRYESYSQPSNISPGLGSNLSAYPLPTSVTSLGGLSSSTRRPHVRIEYFAEVPSLVNASLPFGQAGAAYSTTLVSKGGISLTPTFALAPTSAALPAGLSLNPTTGVLSGTLAAGTEGTYRLVFSVSDGSRTGTSTYDLFVGTFLDDFSTDRGWVSGSDNAAWASIWTRASTWGIMTGRPTALADNSQSADGFLAGTNLPLTGTFPASMTTAAAYFTSPTINLTGFATASLSWSEFAYINNLTTSFNDVRSVELSTDDGATWTVIRSRMHAVTNAWWRNWNRYDLDISQAAGFSQVRVRFGYRNTSTSTTTYPGMCIDDVIVSGTRGLTFKTPSRLGTIGQSQNKIQPGALKIEAIGGATGNTTYAVTAGTLPTGLTLLPTGVFTGDSTATGTYSFTVTASSGAENIAREFSLDIADVGVLWGDDFAQDRGWTYSGQWERGRTALFDGRAPITDASVGNDEMAIGTIMDGYYLGSSLATIQYVTSPALNLTLAAPITLAFREWVYMTTTNQRTLEVSADDGATWQIVQTLTNSVTGTADSAWLLKTLTITSQIGDKPVSRIRFGVNFTSTSQVYSGRYIDDIAIVGEFATPVAITTTTLPSGVEGTPYSATLQYTGGVTGVINWSVDPSSVDALPTGLSLNSSTGAITGTPSIDGASYGTKNITFRALSSPLAPATVTIPLVISLRPIDITTTTLPTGQETTTYTAALAATGGLGSGYTWSVDANSTDQLPPGVGLNPLTGDIFGVPNADGGSYGTYNVTFRATDGVVFATKTFTISIALVPLQITTTTLPSATELTAYSASLAATGGTSQWVFSLAPASGPLPLGLAFHANGRSITGTPAFLTKGTYPLVLQASDGVLTTTAPINLVVNYRFLQIETVALPSGSEGTAYSAQLASTGGSGAYVYAITAGTLPSGLTMSPSGAISGTPSINGAAFGTYILTFSVTDSVATSLAAATAQRSLVISLSPVIISTTSLPNGQEESAYTTTLAATGGTGSFTWSVAANSVDQLPSGLTLSPSGVISGTPTARGTAAGTRLVTFAANDGQQPDVTKVLSLTIGFKPMSITTSSLPNGVEGTAYTATLAGIGGGVTYTWGLAAGSNPIPAGLTLDPVSGVLSGTPAIDNQSAGTRTITFQLSDNQSTPTTKALSITIALRPFVLVTTSFPPAIEGESYSSQIEVTGGTGTYTFSIVAGNLPAGITVNAQTGLLSGTPPINSFGLRNFTFRVTDGASPNIQAASSIEVFPPFLQIVTPPLPAGVENTTYSETIIGVGGFGSYTWSIDPASQHQLPPGLTLSTTQVNNKAAAVISGTFSGPGISVGQYNITLRLTDGLGAFETRVYTIDVALAPLVISITNPPVATIGAAYSQSLGVAGGAGNYLVSLAPGSASPPPGLAVNNQTGVLFGSPTVDSTPNAYNAAGLATYQFSIRVQSGASLVTGQITATVQIQPLAITTNSLASGTEGTAYSATLAGSGGRGSYVWSLAAGQSLPSGLSISNAGVISGIPASNGASYGTHPVTFQLNDGGLAPATRTINLTIALKPIAITSTSMANAMVGSAYSQALAATGGTGNYTWSVATSSPAQLPSGLTLSASGVVAGTPDVGTHSTRIVRFRVSDGVLSPVELPLSLVVSPAPLAVTTATLASGTEGTAYSATLAATGGTGTFQWSIASGSQALPTGLTLSTSGVISGTPAINGASYGTRSITVRVADGVMSPADRQLSITIALRPLVISSTALSNATVGTAYTGALAATGGTGSFSWTVAAGSAAQVPSGLSLNTQTGALTGTPTVGSHGTYAITFELNDGASTAVTKLISLTVVPATLTITTTSIPSGVEGSTYSTTLQAAGGGGAMTWALAATSTPLPTGLSLSASGVISGTPATGGASQGSYTITVQVTDALSTTVTAPLALTIALPTLAITTTSLANGVEGTAYSATLAATGGTGTYTWSLGAGSTPLPNGLTLSAAGVISGIPAINNASAGTRTHIFSVTNGIQTPVTVSLSLTIALRTLAITTTTLATGTEGLAYLSQMVATGGTGTFSWAVGPGSALPQGLSINASSGIISGTPATNNQSAGTRQVSFIVSDGNSQTTATLSLTINLSAVTVTSTTLANGTEGSPYSATLAATGGTGTYTWSLAVTSLPLPSGLSLSASGAITGTPATGGLSFGQRTITVSVSDGVQTATTAPVSITIALQPVVITTSNLSGATEGSTYSAQLSATGGTGTYTWALDPTSQALPAGLNLGAATGNLSGTPSGSGASAGTYNLVIRASSSTATVGVMPLQLVVALQPLSIATASLPNGTEGTAYNASLSATGGTAARTWALAPSSGPLPQGLTLSAAGVISGTPALNGQSHGTRSLIFQVTSGPLTALKGLTVTIALTPVSITTTILPSGTEGSTYTAQLAATGGTGAYTWSLATGSANLPTGLALNPQTGTITGTPATNGQSHGSRQLIVAVSDGVQPAISTNLSITIALQPIVITTTTLPSGTEGLAYSGSLAASGGTGTFTWSVSATGPSLPQGLTLNPQNGAISGIPATNGASFGTRNIVFTANDGVQASVNKSVSLTIALTPVTILTTGLPNGVEGGTYSQTLQASGGTGTYTWSVSPTGQQLPSGITLSASGVISGTFAGNNASAGSYSVVIAANDGQQTPVTRTFNFSVALVTLNIQPITLPLGIIGQPYSAQLSATGGTGAYTWTVAASTPLPAGLMLNAQTGAISGSPIAGAAGNRTISFTLTDGVNTQNATATISVLAPATITTTSLPNARVGAVYQSALTAIGGQGTLTFGVAPTSGLPAGLTLSPSGVISGTPTLAGSSNVTFTVSGTLTTSSKTLTLVVEAFLNRAPTVDAGPDRTIAHTDFSPTNGAVVTGLAGSAVDADNDPLALAWTLVSGPNNGNLAVASPTAAVTGLNVTGGNTIVAGSYLFRLTATEIATNNSVSDTVLVLVVSPTVVPPTAHAGVNQSVNAGTLVALSGAESSDPDYNVPNALTYAWTVTSQPTGANVQLDSNTAVRPKFTPTVPGVYEFQLIVKDNMDLLSTPATVQVMVAPIQAAQPSLARAVANMTFVDTDESTALNTGEAFTLNASAQFAGAASTLSYTWSQVSGPENVLFTNVNATTQTFMAGASGNYLFRLDVAAGGVAGIHATVAVVIAPTGFAPPTAVASIDPSDDPTNSRTILFIPNMGVNGNTANPTIELVSTGSTPGVSYLWRQTVGPTALISGSNTATLSVTPLLSRVYSFELTVTDANNLSASSTVSFAIDTFDAALNPTGNSVPQASISGTAGESQVAAQTGVGLSLLGTVFDANNTTANTNFIYLWVQISGPPVVLDLTNPAAPTFVPPMPAVYVFQLFVDDGNDISLPATVTVNASNEGPAAPPAPKSTGSSGCALSTTSGGSGLPFALAILGLLASALWLRRRRTAA